MKYTIHCKQVISEVYEVDAINRLDAFEQIFAYGEGRKISSCLDEDSLKVLSISKNEDEIK